jgi:prephenate dehydrogenase
LQSARADLFQGGIFCLIPSSSADEAAVKLASDLVAVLGARPIFIDPAEHDGLMAAADHLPAVLALTLMDSAVQQPGWRELRKVAGSSFEVGTRLAEIDPASHAALCLSNRENLLRWIDTFSNSLASLRENVAAGDSEEIARRFGVAVQERQKWLHDRATGQWEPADGVELPKPNMLADAFIGGWWRKRPKKE